MVEAQLQLHGWSKKRRVVIVCQRTRWGCLLHNLSERIAPVIGLPKPSPRLAETG